MIVLVKRYLVSCQLSAMLRRYETVMVTSTAKTGGEEQFSVTCLLSCRMQHHGLAPRPRAFVAQGAGGQIPETSGAAGGAIPFASRQ